MDKLTTPAPPHSHSSAIRCFDTRTARAVGTPYVHASAVGWLGLSTGSTPTPLGTSLERKLLAIVDASHDLWAVAVLRPGAPAKLGAMVDAAAWNESCDALLAVGDGRMTTWLYPHGLLGGGDADLADAAKVSGDPAVVASFGPLATIVSFAGPRVTLQRGDGAIVAANVSAYAPVLHECVAGAKWDEAVRLCRFVKSPALWSALAAMAVAARHLDSAEVALAACLAVDKLAFILHVKALPLPELRNAELALYRRAPEEAEALLLQASPPLVYRAAKLNIRLGRWARALEVAMHHRAHVDTVLWYRRRVRAWLAGQQAAVDARKPRPLPSSFPPPSPAST